MIKLLSTDFDGTLINHVENPPVVPELFEVLARLRKRKVRWAINTGRALSHIVAGLEEFRFPIKPDFVVTSERDIYRPAADGQGWEDYGDWNLKCAIEHGKLFAAAKPIIDAIIAFVEKETGGRVVYEDGISVGLIAASEEEMDRMSAFIDKQREQLPDFHYQRNTVYLRFCHTDYSKGAALGELARLLGIAREEIFAMGDHFNDVSMLDGRFAGWNACPANSAEEVKEAVRNAGGYVARGICSEGVVEALCHYAGGA